MLSLAMLGLVDLPAQHPTATAPAPLARDVLTLSSSHRDDRASAVTDTVHQHFDMPLQHLGLDVHSRAFEPGPPPDLDAARWRGVLVYIDGGEAVPNWLPGWLDDQRRRALRIVLLGDVTPLHTADPDACERLLQGCGLQWQDGFLDDPLRVDVDLHDVTRTAFESAPLGRRVHQGPHRTDPEHDVWLSTRDRRHPGDVRDPVLTGRFGGLALAPWLLDFGAGDAASRWYVDPFRFFRDAFGLRGVPAPDPCVRHGRRRFFFHVDGDGFESPSTVRPGHLAAEVFRDEIVDRHRLPMTISFVVASLTDQVAPTAPSHGIDVARDILRRPWVEPASHGMLHVLDWRRPLPPGTTPRSVTVYSQLGGYRHSTTGDVIESLRFIDRHLATPDRPCRLLLWSGAANPERDALRAALDAGVANLNGGTFRCDAATPSLTVVPPLGRRVGDDLRDGGLLQVYAGATSESAFSGFYDRLPGAFRHIDDTLRRTGSPRLLKPANIHAQFLSAERPARLRALQELLETWAHLESTCVTTAWGYARAVDDALRNCEILPAPGGDGFDLLGFEHCTTLRIDGPTPPIDWRRSAGIVGARRLEGSLYLDIGQAQASLRWAERDSAPTPYLIEANHPCARILRDASGLRLRSEAVDGFDRELLFAGLPADAAATLTLGDALPRAVRADATGRCRVQFTGSGAVPVELRLQ